MTYRVEFTDTAEDDLSRLDSTVAQRVLDRLRWLADNAESVRHKVLTGQFKGAFSIISPPAEYLLPDGAGGFFPEPDAPAAKDGDYDGLQPA